uniref:relaxase/mobilization nuclease domain-containing protein n=1 Tax=Escherichia coli TaxID=562 RepID=UPI00155DAFAD|nr:relaxase/mobilization nuclease domain-containing protein [Escherichia coli]
MVPARWIICWEKTGCAPVPVFLQGKPEEVRELIDASPYAKKYTSGVLSFAEQDLPPGQREKLMASFERVLMPGLDKDQYSVLWVEHQDKGRLELNFLIPNTELLTGKPEVGIMLARLAGA